MVNHIAYDYKEKVDMIYEKEMYFNERDLENEIYFPNILIVRKAKINNQIVNNFQNYFRILKSYIKDQSEMGGSLISFKAKEQTSCWRSQTQSSVWTRPTFWCARSKPKEIQIVE